VIVTYWGVRGSIPVPGPETVRFGGNTACVSVEMDGRVLVLDAGTGIRVLGEALRGTEKEIYLLLSHAHADHVIGFPFFAPLYEPRCRVRVLDHHAQDGAAGWSLLDLYDGIRFPHPGDLSAGCGRVRGDAVEILRGRGFDISRIALNHPGGAFGYRITHRGRSFVHLTDHELDPPGPAPTSFAEIAAFCRGAEVLSHDAQYLSAELAAFRGRGHSSVSQVCELAVASGVRQLILFHHDPHRTDDALLAVEAEARASLAHTGIRCTAAYEGLVCELPPG
jgi:phosphoribosyl 1,2-cyclic phosphodiesterase